MKIAGADIPTIESCSLAALVPSEKFRLSFPLNPDVYGGLAEKLHPLPLMITSPQNDILFGLDYYYFLLETMGAVDMVTVYQLDITDAEALILNLNLKEKYTGLTLYEKLIFLKKYGETTSGGSTALMTEEEKTRLYRCTGLDIAVTPELSSHLDLLLSEPFKALLCAPQMSLKTALSLCRFKGEDRKPLLQLFSLIPFTVSHQLKIVEMVEEILFRDKKPLMEIFEHIGLAGCIKGGLENEKPQKRIVDELFKYRNPLYNQKEAEWQTTLKTLKIPAHIKVTHYPFFEKKQLEMTITLEDPGALKDVLAKLH